MKNNQIQEVFSANLVALRTRWGFTQQETADSLKVKRSRYGSWEEKRCMPSPEHLLNISNLYLEDLTDLLTKKL